MVFFRLSLFILSLFVSFVLASFCSFFCPSRSVCLSYSIISPLSHSPLSSFSLSLSPEFSLSLLSLSLSVALSFYLSPLSISPLPPLSLSPSLSLSLSLSSLCTKLHVLFSFFLPSSPLNIFVYPAPAPQNTPQWTLSLQWITAAEIPGGIHCSNKRNKKQSSMQLRVRCRSWHLACTRSFVAHCGETYGFTTLLISPHPQASTHPQLHHMGPFGVQWALEASGPFGVPPRSEVQTSKPSKVQVASHVLNLSCGRERNAAFDGVLSTWKSRFRGAAEPEAVLQGQHLNQHKKSVV